MQKRRLPTEEETRDNLWQLGHESKLPGRFLVAVRHPVKDLLTAEQAGAIGVEFLRVSDRMYKAGDHWSIDCTMDLMPKMMALLRRRIMEHVPDACQALHVAPFDLTNVSMSAQLHHHQCKTEWFCDASPKPDAFDETIRMGFTFFLHSFPKMFTDGLVEFHDGTTVEPSHNCLLFTHPLQRRRIQETNCYSGDLLHGRWSVTGCLHGPAPDGYGELAHRLLG